MIQPLVPSHFKPELQNNNLFFVIIQRYSVQHSSDIKSKISNIFKKHIGRFLQRNKKLRQVIKPSKYQWNKIQANVIKQNLSCLLICDNKIKTIFVEMYNINTMWKINVYFFLLLSSFQPHRTFTIEYSDRNECPFTISRF